MSIRLVKENYNADEVAYFRATYKLTNCKFTQSILVPGCTSATEAQAKVYDSFGRDKVEWCAASPVWAKGTELQTLLDRGMPILDEAYIVKPEVDLFDDEENKSSYNYGSSDASDDWCECNDCGWFGDGTELINGEICPDCGCADIIHEPMLESKKSIEESTKAGGRFTINFGHWIQAKSFPTQLDLLKFLRSHVISSSSIITLAKNVTDDYMKSTWYDTAENVQKFNLTSDQRHEIFEKGYTKINQNVSEQMQRNPEEDGWPGIVKDITDKVLSRASTIKYEIDNCVRGAYISGTTIDDLIKSLRYLKNDLIDAIDQLQADARHINESIDCETIEDIDNFISDVKTRFPGSEAIYDGDTNTIKITLDNVCESTKNNSVTESFDTDYSNSEVYPTSFTEDIDEKILKELNYMLDGILDCDTEKGLDKDALKFLQSRAKFMKKQLNNKTNELHESTTQNIDMSLFSYILDECLSIYQRGQYEFSEFPTYEEVVDTYDDRITKKDYNKVIKTINNLPDLKFYMIDGIAYLQLSDNHTLFKIDSGIDDVSYNLLIEDAAEAFESKTGVKIFGLGRSGRHICVENTPENILRYKELCDIQSELEQKVIDIANNYKLDDLDESKIVKEDLNDPDEVLIFKRNVNSAICVDDIQLLIFGLSDGVAEAEVQEAFDMNELKSIREIKDAVISAIDVYLEDNEWLGESLLQDLQKDHKAVKDTYGQEVYDALNAYIENGNDLGDVLYKESEWNKFVDWAKKEKGIEIKSDINESKSIKKSNSITSEFDNLISNIKDKYPEVDFIINAHTKLGCEVVADSNKERDMVEDEIINVTNGTKFKYINSADRLNKSRGHRAYVNIIFDFNDESLNESNLSISDLKAFYNTSDSIDKNKYPNFFVWYDDMVRSGRYKNESLIESDCKFEEDYWTVKPDWDDYCPHCCNRSLVGAGDGRAVCDSCGEEYNIEPMPDGRVKITKLEESLTESKQAVKNILQPLVTNGRVRAFRSDEKCPRGFAFKSGNGSSGEVSYNGKDYVYAVVDGELRVMTDAEAGWNWSETIYAKESLTVDDTLKIEKDIANLMSESGLDVDYVDCFATRSEVIKLNIKVDNIDAVEDLVKSYCENNCLMILSEYRGPFGNIVYTLSKDTNYENANNTDEVITEKVNIGDTVKVSTPGNMYYDGRTGIVDYVESNIVSVLFDDGKFPKMNNFDMNQISRIGD